MTEPTPSAPARPQAVTVAFWCWVVAAVLLMVGGMLTATAEVPAAYRGLVLGFGAITALAGAAMAFSAGRARSGDNRFRRAAVALSMAIVIVVGLLALLDKSRSSACPVGCAHAKFQSPRRPLA